MRLDNEKPDYDSIEDRRGQGGGGMGGGFGFPGGGRRINIPIGGRGGGLSLKTIIFLVIIYFVLKIFLGIDLLQVLNGGGGLQIPGGSDSQITVPDGSTDVATGGNDQPIGTGNNSTTGNPDAAKEFVARVVGSNNRVWSGIFQGMGKTYEKPKLVLFDNYVQSACGAAQSAMGPFYCPGDQKVYIDLSFYRDMETKLGAGGDFPRAYVIAHEVGHHVQNLLGTADKVTRARMNATDAESNALSVRMELQADCYAGIWTQKADASAKILEAGDIEEALNAAAAIGDDRLQKRSQGYVVPESFTHGTSEQRMNWFQRGYKAKSIDDCDTFNTQKL